MYWLPALQLNVVHAGGFICLNYQVFIMWFFYICGLTGK